MSLFLPSPSPSLFPLPCLFIAPLCLFVFLHLLSPFSLLSHFSALQEDINIRNAIKSLRRRPKFQWIVFGTGDGTMHTSGTGERYRGVLRHIDVTIARYVDAAKRLGRFSFRFIAADCTTQSLTICLLILFSHNNVNLFGMCALSRYTRATHIRNCD